MTTHRVGIVGACGYAGRELVRWVTLHPNLELCCVYSRSKSGQSFADAVPDFLGFVALNLEPIPSEFTGIDILFLATPHGATAELVPLTHNVPIVVDLSRDHRHTDGWITGNLNGKHPLLVHVDCRTWLFCDGNFTWDRTLYRKVYLLVRYGFVQPQGQQDLAPHQNQRLTILNGSPTFVHTRSSSINMYRRSNRFCGRLVQYQKLISYQLVPQLIEAYLPLYSPMFILKLTFRHYFKKYMPTKIFDCVQKVQTFVT